MKTISASAPDKEINAAVAEHVAGLHYTAGVPCGWLYDGRRHSDAPPYATSADAVLPLLEARAMVVEISYCSIGCTWSVNIVGHKTTWRHTGESNEPLPRVVCLALLVSHGFTLTS